MSVAEEVAKSIQSNTQNSEYCFYSIISVCASTGAALYYILRYRSITKKIPTGSANDLKALCFMLCSLCLWNSILAYYASTTFVNTKRLSQFVEKTPEAALKHQLDIFSSNTDSSVFSVRNGLFLRKDLRYFAYALGAMLVLNGFSNAIQRTLEYITFVKGNNVSNSIVSDEDFEKLVDLTYTKPRSSVSKLTKSVSFDLTLTTFNESGNVTLTDSKIVYLALLPSFNFKKVVVRYLLTFFLILTAYVFFLRDDLIMNSTAVLFVHPMFTVKFDHVYITMITMFLIDVFRKFVEAANHPSIKNFPHLTSMACHFTWCYLCITLSFSFGLTEIATDTLLNIMSRITVAAINRTNQTSVDVTCRHFLTQLIFSYLEHSVVPLSCYGEDALSCSTEEYISSLSGVFVWVKSVLINCWMAANVVCFVLLPVFIWILLVEMKVAKLYK